MHPSYSHVDTPMPMMPMPMPSMNMAPPASDQAARQSQYIAQLQQLQQQQYAIQQQLAASLAAQTNPPLNMALAHLMPTGGAVPPMPSFPVMAPPPRSRAYQGYKPAGGGRRVVAQPTATNPTPAQAPPSPIRRPEGPAAGTAASVGPPSPIRKPTAPGGYKHVVGYTGSRAGRASARVASPRSPRPGLADLRLAMRGGAAGAGAPSAAAQPLVEAQGGVERRTVR